MPALLLLKLYFMSFKVCDGVRGTKEEVCGIWVILSWQGILTATGRVDRKELMKEGCSYAGLWQGS
jgi:hypothetical protein